MMVVWILVLLSVIFTPVHSRGGGRGRTPGRGAPDLGEQVAAVSEADEIQTLPPVPPPPLTTTGGLSELKEIDAKELDLTHFTRPPQKLEDAPKAPQGKALATGIFDPEADLTEAVVQEAKPQWAVQETYDGLKSFVLGVVEELMMTIKGRLPCEPLKYVLSNSAWMVAFQATGLIIDIGADGKVLRSMSAAYPSRVIIGVGDQPDIKLPTNVQVVTLGSIPDSTSAAIVHFSCSAFTCASSALQVLSPLLQPGTVIIFNKVVGYPSYMAGQLRVFYEMMESLPHLGFELIGGRFVSSSGSFCLSQRPRAETGCPTSVAIKLVAIAGRAREPGGHIIQKSMPIVAQMCPGNPSPDEAHHKRTVDLNTSLISIKTSFQSQVSSLIIDRQQHDKNQEKSLSTVRLLQTKVTALESTMQMLLTITVGLAAVVAILIYRIAWTSQKRQQFLR